MMFGEEYMSGWGMAGGGIFMLLIIILLVLAIVALGKYIFRG